MKKLFLFLNTIVIFGTALQAEERTSGIRIEGRKTVIVSSAQIRLSDLAEISSASMNDDDAVIALQKIRIDRSPEPGEQTTITASRILERLREEGVKLSEVIYVLPRVTAVTRAARELTLSEIELALRDALKQSNKEISLKRINYQSPLKVEPSFGSLKAALFQSSKPGEINFTITGSTDDGQERTYSLSAQIDKWIKVPIASQYLAKGSRIDESNIAMARMNIADLPHDTFHTVEDVIGKEVTHDIQYGESFRKNKLNVPAAVKHGSKVVLIYKVGALEATATGIAQEDGLIGQEIRVRNDSSKKVIVGKVIEEGKVGVNP